MSQLIKKNSVSPVCVGATGFQQLVGVFTVLLRQTDPRLGNLGKHPDHFLPTGDVLVKVAEVGPEFLQVRLVVELLQLSKHQRHIDGDGDQQWCQRQQQQEQGYLAAKFHKNCVRNRGSPAVGSRRSGRARGV